MKYGNNKQNKRAEDADRNLDKRESLMAMCRGVDRDR